jgi:hypothetical protein
LLRTKLLVFFNPLDLDPGLRLYRRHSRLPVLFVEANQRELTLPFGVNDVFSGRYNLSAYVT